MASLITAQRSVSSLIKDFGEGNIAVPEIQRDVVWDSEQVKGLVDSINQAYPCGSLIFWEPRDRDAGLIRSMIRPERLIQFENRLPEYFLLDGQQRLTSLASVLLDRGVLRKVLAELEEELPHLYGNLRRFPKDIVATSDGGGYKFPWVALNRLFDGSIKDDPDYRNHLTQGQRSSGGLHSADSRLPVPRSDRPWGQLPDSRRNLCESQFVGNPTDGRRNSPRQDRSALERNHEQVPQVPARPCSDGLRLGPDFPHASNHGHRVWGPSNKKLAAKVSRGDLTKVHLDRTWKEVTWATDAIIRVLQREMTLDKTKFFIHRKTFSCRLSITPRWRDERNPRPWQQRRSCVSSCCRNSPSTTAPRADCPSQGPGIPY